MKQAVQFGDKEALRRDREALALVDLYRAMSSKDEELADLMAELWGYQQELEGAIVEGASLEEMASIRASIAEAKQLIRNCKAEMRPFKVRLAALDMTAQQLLDAVNEMPAGNPLAV